MHAGIKHTSGHNPIYAAATGCTRKSHQVLQDTVGCFDDICTSKYSTWQCRRHVEARTRDPGSDVEHRKV
jgi:hypothetical protein